MAHFAEVDMNIVKRVIVVSDQDCAGGQYPNSESSGQEFISSLGIGGEWKQTSYNGNFRKQFAGKGYRFDAINDVFIAPQPFSSWTLDANFDWQPPTAKPEGNYTWDEETLSWIALASE